VSYDIDVQALNGFAGDVALTLKGLSASQATWSFSPATIAGGAGRSQLTVTTAAGLAPGTYPLTVTGASGTSTREVRVTLEIPPPPDFSLAVSPTSQSTAPGGALTYTVSAQAVGGFSGDVALSLSGLSGAEASWSFAPAAIAGGAGAAQLTVTTTAAIAPGVHTLTITGTSGTLSHSVTASLVVPDFTLTASPSSRSTTPGTAVTYTVSIGSLNGFAGTVALSLSGLPAGSTSSFAPASVSGKGTSQLTVTPAASLAPGTYPLTVTGTSGAIVHTARVTLVVASPPDFGIAASPASASVVAGQSVTYTVTVSSKGGFAGSVSLSVSGLPSLATASFAPNPRTAPGTSVLTVRTAATTPRGTYTLTITGRSGTLSHSTTVTCVVR
jgi:uncharacterized membrane protein